MTGTETLLLEEKMDFIVWGGGEGYLIEIKWQPKLHLKYIKLGCAILKVVQLSVYKY